MASVETGLSLERSDEDSVGGEEVGNGGTLGKEFWRGSARHVLHELNYLPGFDRMSKEQPGLELASRIVRIDLVDKASDRLLNASVI